MYHAIKRGYVVFVIGPLLSGTDNLCFERSWPPDDSVEIAEVRPMHAWSHIFMLSFSGAHCLLTSFPCLQLLSLSCGRLASSCGGGSWLSCAFQVQTTALC